MKIPFSIKYKAQIESGEYKVETRDGRPARIICWDACESKPIVAIVSGLVHQYAAHGYANYLEDIDLFIITPEPELTEFEQELANFFKERNAILPDKDGVYNKHDCDEFLHKSANKLLELAKKEICKGCTVGFEQYWKGREDAKKEYERPITFHYPSYPTYEPPCFHGGVCTNPMLDCINCPRRSSGTINTSATNKAE